MLIASMLLAAEFPRALTEAEKSRIKVAVGRQLRDPYSAQYEWPDADRPTIYCGVVNAKNAYGGYAGREVFMIITRKGSAGIEPQPGLPVTLTTAEGAGGDAAREACTAEGRASEPEGIPDLSTLGGAPASHKPIAKRPVRKNR